jgi:hypothetical protein
MLIFSYTDQDDSGKALVQVFPTQLYKTLLTFKQDCFLCSHVLGMLLASFLVRCSQDIRVVRHLLGNAYRIKYRL